MMPEKGTISPRPYGRLITMLGEQLIKNEKIALLELIKNSYDADASWVQIRFINLNKSGTSFEIGENSVIEIEDDGIGMTFDTIKDSWMNPAAPYKYIKKKMGEGRTEKGRIMQGEKGIGRYSAFKLGYAVEIFTRAKQPEASEIYLKCDLSVFDDEILAKKGDLSNKPIFIEDVKYDYEIRTSPERIKQQTIVVQGSVIEKQPHGTLIRVSNLKGKWTDEKIRDIFEDCLRLVSPFGGTEFVVDILLNGEYVFLAEEKDRLTNLLNIADIKIDGEVDREGRCKFILNEKKREMSLLDDLSDDRDIRKRFYDKGEGLKRRPECGSFKFKFYVFDFKRKASLASPLSNDDRELIRSHRTYVYRDGIRVYPYGDPSDDWLGLDIARGLVKAGSYLSNDQVVGYVGITSKDNPDLRDKSSREGLMDIGNAYQDIRILLLGILGYLNKELKKLKTVIREKGLYIKESLVERDLSVIENHLNKQKDSEGIGTLNRLIKDYHEEKKVFSERVEVVEDLAGVGMAVDAASHDLMIMMTRAAETLNMMIKMAEKDNFDHYKLRGDLDKLRGQFAYIEDQLHGIQPLFRSSRRRSKDLRISDIIDKVKLYYSVPIERRNIKVIVDEKGPPIVVKCSEGIILQVFINLMDNAVYWLTTSTKENKEIKILIDGTKCEVVFTDNGPGVRESDLPFIFEPFFSTKGIKGRGLGLYIARQLLWRYDYEINYIIDKDKRVLDGANFLVSFGENNEEGEE